MILIPTTGCIVRSPAGHRVLLPVGQPYDFPDDIGRKYLAMGSARAPVNELAAAEGELSRKTPRRRGARGETEDAAGTVDNL